MTAALFQSERAVDIGQIKPHEVKRPRVLVNWLKQVSINTFEREYRETKAYVEKLIDGIPRHIARKLVEQYAKRYNSETAKKPLLSANLYLREATKLLREILAKCPFDNLKALRRDHVLERIAKDAAEHCGNLTYSYARDSNGQTPRTAEEYAEVITMLHSQLVDYLTHWKIKPLYGGDELTTEQREAAILRMNSDKWWLKKLRKIRDQYNEYLTIAAGLVRSGQQQYASNITVQEWRQQQRANRAYLELMEIVNEDTDERFNLSDIAQATAANPKNRRIELMVRCRGLEELAEDMGYQAFFITWTAAGSYHRVSDTWNKATPSETQKHLCGQWAKCRASINRQQLEWYGVRVAEPHADATPHWHMLIFCNPDHARAIIKTMRDYATEPERAKLIEAHRERVTYAPDKTKRKIKHWYEPRFTAVEIDPEQGSATGYIAKYISKNINAEHIGDESDHDATGTLRDAVDRVNAWASRWRIRQFQFFGAERVTVWRECRKIKEAVECPELEKVRQAADSSRWSEFTQLLKTVDVTVKYEEDRTNKYGEKLKQVIGLICNGFEQITKTAHYRLERKRRVSAQLSKEDAESPFALVRRFKARKAPQQRDSAVSRSTVNNCTGVPEKVTEQLKIPGIPDYLHRPLLAGARVETDGRGYFIDNNELREYTPCLI